MNCLIMGGWTDGQMTVKHKPLMGYWCHYRLNWQDCTTGYFQTNSVTDKDLQLYSSSGTWTRREAWWRNRYSGVAKIIGLVLAYTTFRTMSKQTSSPDHYPLYGIALAFRFRIEATAADNLSLEKGLTMLCPYRALRRELAAFIATL